MTPQVVSKVVLYYSRYMTFRLYVSNSLSGTVKILKTFQRFFVFLHFKKFSLLSAKVCVDDL